MGGPANEFGPQYVPWDEDINRSRQDTGSGWDQALTMDRAPMDTYGLPTIAAAVPPGVQIARDHTALYLERNTGNPSDLVSPLLLLSNLCERFDSPLALIEWAPEPGVIHGGGYTSQVREDVLPQTAKMLPDYYYGVIDTQELLDEAVSRTRKALYGR